MGRKTKAVRTNNHQNDHSALEESKVKPQAVISRRGMESEDRGSIIRNPQSISPTRARYIPKSEDNLEESKSGGSFQRCFDDDSHGTR